MQDKKLTLHMRLHSKQGLKNVELMNTFVCEYLLPLPAACSEVVGLRSLRGDHCLDGPLIQ